MIMDYKRLHSDTMAQCRLYVDEFARLMGYDTRDVDFVGGDPFGVISIGDDFWSMSDIFYVLSDIDKWKQYYGDDLTDVILDWYYYSLDVHELNYKIDERDSWVKATEHIPERIEGTPFSKIVVMQKDENGSPILARYRFDSKRWYSIPKGKFAPLGYWKYVDFQKQRHIPCINLKSWLMGARPDMPELDFRER